MPHQMERRHSIRRRADWIEKPEPMENFCSVAPFFAGAVAVAAASGGMDARKRHNCGMRGLNDRGRVEELTLDIALIYCPATGLVFCVPVEV